MYLVRYLLYSGIFALCCAKSGLRYKSGIEDIINLDKNTRMKNIQVINGFLDKYFIKNFNAYMVDHQLDSVVMKNFKIEGNVVNIHAELSLTNGWLKGIASVKRLRPVSIKVNYPNYDINILLSLDDLNGGYHYYGNAAGVSVTGDGTGSSGNSKINLEVSFNAIDYTFEYKHLTIRSAGEFDINFVGNFVGSVPSIWIDTYFPLAKNVLKETLDTNLENALYSFIDEYNTLGCDLSGNC